MPRIKVDDNEPDKQPIEESKTPDHSAIIDKPNPSTTDELLKTKSGTSSLSAFCAFPEKVDFEGEDDDENIILLLRAHIITNLKWMIAVFFMIISPIILFPILVGYNVMPPISAGTGLIFTLFWYMAAFTYAFISFLYWYFNVYIVTNERIVDVDWYSVIFHQTNSTRISKIQDVSSNHIGVFASMFDYGTVHIETAAEESNFEFVNVPHPDLVSKKIQELMEIEEKEWEVKPNNDT